MKKFILLVDRNLFIFTILFMITAHQNYASDEKLLGITWGNSLLVSFDPYSGTITEVHSQLNPNDSFLGLAYDSNHHILYALSQSNHNLYSINPITLNIQHIGNLHIPCGQYDIGGLTYNPSTDSFFTTLVQVNGNSSQLLTVNVNNAEVRSLGTITNGYCFSPSYNECDGKIYGFSLFGSGSWDSQYKSSLVSINPDDISVTTLFETPYHAISGLAKKPNENIFYSWVNWTSHFYAKIDLEAKTIIPLGNSDAVNVVSDAMIYKNFHVGSGSLLPTEEDPASFTFFGHVTEINDPYDLLGSEIAIGDKFSGKFLYDINGIIVDTLEQSPYGISIQFSNHTFYFDGLSASVGNNYYDCNSGTIYDSFSLSSENWDNGYDNIILTLTDFSATSLSNNIYLPKSFDLTSWDKTELRLSSRADYWDDSSNFSIHGVIDAIISNIDSDEDGVPDYNDHCPNDPKKTEPGVCGCSIADIDSDGDGTNDCNDLCPKDPKKTQPGTCGCGIDFKAFFADTDGDGFGDPMSTISLCASVDGYVLDNTDCNDNDPLIFPGATEIENGSDDNCDGRIDEGFPDNPINPANNENNVGGGGGGCFISSIQLSAAGSN